MMEYDFSLLLWCIGRLVNKVADMSRSFLATLCQYASDDDADGGADVDEGCLFDRKSVSVLFAEAAAEPSVGQGATGIRSVGRGLLQSMKPPSLLPSSANRAESYQALSTGGFLDASTAPSLRHVAVGAVIRLAKASDLGVGSKRERDVSSPTSDEQPKNFSSSSAFSLTGRFQRESELKSEEERRYGRRLSPEMYDALGEITRLDAAMKNIEVLFLSGERRKLSVHDVKPAGFVEQSLYRRWKNAPELRPVALIPSPVASPVGDISAPLPPQSPSSWWVLPKLVVRVVAETAPQDWAGVKAVVTAIQRKESRIRLMRCSSGGSPNKQSAEVEVEGLESVESVVPKRGEMGMLVLGERKGELVTVEARHRTESEGLVRVTVSPVAKLGESFDVLPSEICALVSRIQE